jgi:transposase-like protein
LHALQPILPHLSRSALHRCLQQRAISRLPEVGGDKHAKKRFKRYPIGYFHLDLAEVRTAEGKLNLFVAIDRTSKFAFVRLEKRAGKMEAAQFLRDLLQALRWLGLLEQLPGVFQVDFRLVYAAAVSSVSALKQA